MVSKVPKRDISGILLLDKPYGVSSNQALQSAKRLFRAEKAGHTGSLDPLATGLLPLCFGQATKISSYLLDSDKRYLAQVRLGEKTTTGDAEGAVVARSDPSQLPQGQLEQALSRFIGTISQVPPMYSALKREGQPLYKLARQGLEVEREAREVRIHSLQLVSLSPEVCEIDVVCSKGTYIRTLVEDIAESVAQKAHLKGLRRLEVGSFRAPRMLTLEDLEKTFMQGGYEALDSCLVSPAQALTHWISITVNAEQAFFLSRGQAVRIEGVQPTEQLALLNENRHLLGLAEASIEGLVLPKRWMA